MTQLPSDDRKWQWDERLDVDHLPILRHASMAARAEVRALLKAEPADASIDDVLERHSSAIKRIGEQALKAMLDHVGQKPSRKSAALMRSLVHADVRAMFDNGMPTPLDINLVIPAGMRAWDVELLVDAEVDGDLLTAKDRQDQKETWKARSAKPVILDVLVQATIRLCQRELDQLAKAHQGELQHSNNIETFWPQVSRSIWNDLSEMAENRAARLVRRANLSLDDAMAITRHSNYWGSDFDMETVSSLEDIFEHDETMYWALAYPARRVAYEATVQMVRGLQVEFAEHIKGRQNGLQPQP